MDSPRDAYKACSFLSISRLCLCAGTDHLREFPELPLAHSYHKAHPAVAVFWQVLFLQASQVLGPWHTTIGFDEDEHVRFCSFWNVGSSSWVTGSHVGAFKPDTCTPRSASWCHGRSPGPACWLWVHVCSEHWMWNFSFIFWSKTSIFIL